jgi:hypothetical protein
MLQVPKVKFEASSDVSVRCRQRERRRGVEVGDEGEDQTDACTAGQIENASLEEGSGKQGIEI